MSATSAEARDRQLVCVIVATRGSSIVRAKRKIKFVPFLCSETDARYLSTSAGARIPFTSLLTACSPAHPVASFLKSS